MQYIIKKKKLYKCKSINCNGNEEIVKVPSSWSSKLFMQELDAMNIGVKFELDEFIYNNE